MIRKHLGWTHIASRHAEAVNLFHRQHLNPYLNFHRPCGIPELRTLARGKIKRVYRQWETPWDILRSLPDWETRLRAETNAARSNFRRRRTPTPMPPWPCSRPNAICSAN